MTDGDHSTIRAPFWPSLSFVVSFSFLMQLDEANTDNRKFFSSSALKSPGLFISVGNLILWQEKMFHKTCLNDPIVLWVGTCRHPRMMWGESSFHNPPIQTPASILHNLPCKFKTKQRIVFRMIHVKDYLLPRGQSLVVLDWVFGSLPFFVVTNQIHFHLLFLP